LLVYGGLCLLIFGVLGALGTLLVVRMERRREAALGPRPTPVPPVHRSGDLTLYLRLEGEGAETMAAPAAVHGPHGILPPTALRATAEATLDAMDFATHAALLVAAFQVEPVRFPKERGLVVCLRVRALHPLVAPSRPLHRLEVAELLRSLAALDAAQIVSVDFLLAPETTDGAAALLEPLLGPHALR